MIRTIGVYPERLNTEDFVVMRNLSRENLEKHLGDGALFWIDIVDIESDELEWVSQYFNLHPTIVEDIKRVDKRPTITTYTDYLFIRLIQPTMQNQTLGGYEVHCILGDNFLLTIRDEPSKGVDKAYNHVLQNTQSWAKGSSFLLFLTVQQIVDAYYPLLDRISDRISTLEERLMEGKTEKHDRRSIHRIKQELISMRQMVAPQREVLSNLISAERVIRDDGNIALFRHLYERLLRVYDVIDSQRELSSNVLDMYQSYESNRLVDAVNRLTIFSMIFLPLTFLTGLFELNFATTFDQLVLPISGEIMFVMVIVSMFLSALGMVVVFRKYKWL